MTTRFGKILKIKSLTLKGLLILMIRFGCMEKKWGLFVSNLNLTFKFIKGRCRPAC
jgi:hypothetical protein